MADLSRPLRLGTRASPLALAQAHMAAAALRTAHGWGEDAIEICPVVASGDKVQDRALAEIGGKALWTKELDWSLGQGEIDFSVHSMKDVETIRPPDITIAAMLPRADVRDRLIGVETVDALRQGAVVGTSSPRRAAQLRRMRPDLSIVLFRGNVATRLAKLASGEVDATLLAAAGLDRLGQGDVGHVIELDTMLPAPAQGAVGIEARTDDQAMRAILGAISHDDTFDCVMAERALLLALGGNCHSPIAALAQVDGETITLRAELLSPDGQEHVTGSASFVRGDRAAAAALGHSLLARASDAVRANFSAPLVG